MNQLVHVLVDHVLGYIIVVLAGAVFFLLAVVRIVVKHVLVRNAGGHITVEHAVVEYLLNQESWGLFLRQHVGDHVFRINPDEFLHLSSADCVFHDLNDMSNGLPLHVLGRIDGVV